MKIFTLTNKILSFLLIIIFWFILSKIYPPVVVPSVSQVWESIKVLQVVPPISWLILAILWLGLNGKPAILIVSISIFCIMTISLVNSINNIDKKLLEVANVFHLTKFKKWKYIIVPSLYPAFETALIVCLGTGVKITNARINIETEMIIAWSVIIVGIYFILGGIVKCLKKCQWIRRFWYRSLLAKDIMKN